MEISFEGPVFFAKEDEDRFFGWIYALPEYERIVGAGTTLHLHLRTPVDAGTVEQLLVIFRRWCIDTTPLQPLRSSETERLTLWDTDLTAASSRSLLD